LDNWMIAVEWVGSSKVRFQDSASSKSIILVSEKNTQNTLLYAYILMHCCRREWKRHQCFLLIILSEKQTVKQAPWNN
jgi:hypothetical protein